MPEWLQIDWFLQVTKAAAVWALLGSSLSFIFIWGIMVIIIRKQNSRIWTILGVFFVLGYSYFWFMGIAPFLTFAASMARGAGVVNKEIFVPTPNGVGFRSMFFGGLVTYVYYFVATVMTKPKTVRELGNDIKLKFSNNQVNKES